MQSHSTPSKLPIVYLHADGFGPQQWEPYLSHGLGGRQQQAITLSGYGNTPFDASDSALAQDLDLMARVLGEQQSPVHLVGHSYGGVLALVCALQLNPSSIASLVLMEPIAFSLLDEIDARTGTNLGDSIRWARSAPFDTPHPQSIEGWLTQFVDYWSGPGTWRQRPPHKQRQLIAWGPRMANAHFDAMNSPLTAGMIGQLRMPSTVLYGSDTTDASRGLSRWLAEQLPKGRSREIRGADHFFPRTYASEVIRYLEQHLEPLERGA